MALEEDILTRGANNDSRGDVIDADFTEGMPKKNRKRLVLAVIAAVSIIGILTVVTKGGNDLKSHTVGMSAEDQLLLSPVQPPPARTTENTQVSSGEASMSSSESAEQAHVPQLTDTHASASQPAPTPGPPMIVELAAKPAQLTSPVPLVTVPVKSAIQPVAPSTAQAVPPAQSVAPISQEVSDLKSRIAVLEQTNSQLNDRVKELTSEIKKRQAAPAVKASVTEEGAQDVFRGKMESFGVVAIMTDGLLMRINDKDIEIGPGKAIPGMKGRFVRGIPSTKTVITEKAVYQLSMY